MNARCFLLSLLLTPLCLALGCTGSPDAPTDGAVPDGDEKPKAERNLNLPVAPAPHAAGEKNSLPFIVRPWTELRSAKPWDKLIVGKWLKVKELHIEANGYQWWGTYQGQKVREFTPDGKVIERYSYKAAPNHPKGIEASTWQYRINGNNLFPTSTHDDGIRVRESTTFIESLTENELVTSSIMRTRFSLEVAKQEAAQRKIPVEQVLADVTETRGRTVYVRLKDKDK